MNANELAMICFVCFIFFFPLNKMFTFAMLSHRVCMCVAQSKNVFKTKVLDFLFVDFINRPLSFVTSLKYIYLRYATAYSFV